jgi:hypothetical protein
MGQAHGRLIDVPWTHLHGLKCGDERPFLPMVKSGYPHATRQEETSSSKRTFFVSRNRVPLSLYRADGLLRETKTLSV